MSDNHLFTVEEAATKLRLHLDTARRFIREGKIPAIKVGRRHLIPESSLQKFLDGGFVQGSFVVATRPTAQPDRDTICSLRVKSIRTDGGTQPRGAMDFDVVEAYQDAIEAGAKFPAVDVFYDGTDYWLADGFHRLQATYQADRDGIEANVHQGTLEDAQWYRLGANKTNGLYRSNADKQRAVQAALVHGKAKGLTDDQIAKHCGVAPSLVTSCRETPITKKKKPTRKPVDLARNGDQE